MAKADLYKLLYRKWKPVPEPRQPGYTLMLLAPGDLPVFLKIAMDVCNRQDTTHRVETLVLPDIASPQFTAAYEVYKKDWQGGPIRVIPLNWLEGKATKKFKNPHLNCWLQFNTAVNNIKTQHAIWHDSDLFINDPQFLKGHYEELASRKLGILGVSDAWDKFYRENGYPHVVATWEMAFDLDWARRFQPWEHRGHDGFVDGKPVTFDIVFNTQVKTPPEQIGKHIGADKSFVHFNYVIGTYRWFQRSVSRFEDKNFRILLVRLLVDAYETSDWKYEAPSIPELADGIKNPDARVIYRDPATASNYPEFRAKLQNLIDSDIVDEAKKQSLRKGIAPFDAAFGPR